MGNCFTGVFRRRNVKRHIVLILIGLDNAGKTKTVNNLAGEVDDKVLPTVGFKAVNLIHKDTPVTIYDLGGGPNFRQIWPQYYSEVHGIIFVIDSSDFSRLDECKIVLEEVLSHDKISGKPVLVLANKQDKTGALDDIDVVEKLNIEPLVNKYRCPTLVESYTNNIENKGKKPKIDPDLKKGYLWLLNYIVSRYGDINLRVQTDMHADLERRKRLMNKSTASQTVSEDIVGFENPNYTIEKFEKSDNSEKCEEGVIVVKPIKNKVNSVDTTITIESVDESGNTSARPKLSPLFGRTSDNSLTEARIELEPRSEYRKLSPIVKVKSGVNHIDFQHRPQSSPTSKVKSGSQSKESSVVVMSDVRSRTWDASERHKEVALTDREWERSGAHSDSHFGPNGGATVASDGPRPASASALVRRQLELLPAQHKRRLSLRYMHRNRTSPERSTMLIYEPKSAQRQLDQGDFEKATHLY